MIPDRLYGGVEAGGTKFVCVLGSGPGHILDQVRIPTTTPAETLEQVIQYFQPHVTSGEIDAIGVGCFGPVDLDPNSSTYGFITSTPKPGWRYTDVRGTLQRALNIRVAFDMDVNAAALGEFIWGASRGVDPSLYLTVGTGIGGGYIANSKPLVGLLNLEMGHVRIPHDLQLDPFPGACPFHGDCFEGLASGPAIQKRRGVKGETIPDDDPFWDVEVGYIASALANYIFTLSPKKIVLGGGIMERRFLFPKIRRRVLDLLNGYVDNPTVTENIHEYIVPPGLGSGSGSLGAIALAQQAPLGG
jgi:fructokinase